MFSTRLSLRVALLALPASLLLAGLAQGQDASYHILLTNDDGIESPGIQALAAELSAIGQVHLIAPCGERSGSSMSVLLRDELQVREITRDGQTLGHCVDTTPAGAVLLGILNLAPDDGFDLVVSGINRGANVGTSAHMSGTVGAAMMGALYKLPAVAASYGAPSMDFSYPASFVASFVQEMRSRPAMPGVVFTINIPTATAAETTGVTVAKMGGAHLHFAYEEVEGDADGRRFAPRISLQSEAPADTDTEAFLKNRISIAPLMFDWTAYSVVEQLQGWNLSHEVGGR